MNWQLDEDRIRSMIQHGWTLMLSKSNEAFNLRMRLKDDGLACPWNPYMDGNQAFLYRHGPLGVWRNSGEIQIVPFMKGEDLTYGIGAIWRCGQGVLDSSCIWTVNLA